ncbi:MAG: hypothetical protein A2X56_02290 [Nitrospirae bacterium GWC2_57_13]|nr:MAG: hypothetical protein A2072_05720 [Nitrospirae bacterium GWC1_57_7]OGW28811.1 MAG: hypothetical protein A2X56_02290 [Nitrospirae bacterium GWC2_57_13]
MPLREFISDKLGLYYDDDRLNVLHHRLAPLAAVGGFTSLTRYYQHLVNGPKGTEALYRIAAQLTNNETYFFRETEQINAVIRDVLPGLLKKLGAGQAKKLKILSAGCSTGEEAYTMAMLLDESGIVEKGGVEILATDIDPEALDTGKKGRYSTRSFRGGEQGRLKKYFTRIDGGYAVNEATRSTVRFQQGNILDVVMEEAFHVILCRNVLIYFSDAAMDRAARNFHRMLVPGGVLLLGHSESFCRVNTDLAPLRLEGAVVYQKQ